MIALYMCGTCDHWHRAAYGGDCRNDSERFTDGQRDSLFGEEGEGWVEYVPAIPDLTAHPLPFGGLALVPVSDAGRGYLLDGIEYRGAFHGLNWFPSRDACMAGLPVGAIGFEPQDWPEIVNAARDAGLIVEGA
jgi:hypothetical protein